MGTWKILKLANSFKSIIGKPVVIYLSIYFLITIKCHYLTKLALINIDVIVTKEILKFNYKNDKYLSNPRNR